MCQINPSSFNYAQESDHVRMLREQLANNTNSSQIQQPSIIKDPQSSAVLELMQRLLQQG